MIFRIFSILIISMIPIIMYFFSKEISEVFSKNELQIIDLIKVILPLIFSVIVLLINSLLNHKKEIKSNNELKKDTYNNEIKINNLLFLNTTKSFNYRVMYLRSLILVIERFREIEGFIKLEEYWQTKMKDNINVSNSIEFRNKLRNFVLEIKQNTNKFQNMNEFLQYSKIEHKNSFLISYEEELFLFQFIKSLNFTNTEKNKLSISSQVLADDYTNKTAISKFNNEIFTIKKSFESIDKNKDKYINNLYGVIIQLFFAIECLNRDIVPILNFLETFQREFKNYIDEKKKKFDNLDITMEVTQLTIPKDIKKYLFESSTYKYFNI